MDHTAVVPSGVIGPVMTALLLALGLAAVFATIAVHARLGLARRRRAQQWIAQIEAPSPALAEGEVTLTGTAVAEGAEPLVELRDSQEGIFRRGKPSRWYWSPRVRAVTARPFALALRGSEVQVRVVADGSTRLDASSQFHSNQESRLSKATRERHARLDAGESLSVRGRLRKEQGAGTGERYRDVGADRWVLEGAVDAPLHLRTKTAAAVIAKTPLQARGLMVVQWALVALVLVSSARLLLLRYGSEVSVGTVVRVDHPVSRNGRPMRSIPWLDVAFTPRGPSADEHLCTALRADFEGTPPRQPIREQDLVRIAYLPVAPEVCEVAGPLRVASFMDFCAMVFAVPFLIILWFASLSAVGRDTSCVPWFERGPNDDIA